MTHKRMTIVLSGPSGVGKGTICEEIVRRMPDMGVSISTTTRAPRPKKDGSMEQNGVEYFFADKETFEKKVREGGFLEHAYVHGNYYGTSREYVEQLKQAGKDVLLEIDMQGAFQVKADDPSAVTVFVLPPEKTELRARLEGRHSETPETLEKRMKDAGKQMPLAYTYDYVVLNDDLETAVRDVIGIIEAARLRTSLNKETIDRINKSFQED